MAILTPEGIELIPLRGLGAADVAERLQKCELSVYRICHAAEWAPTTAPAQHGMARGGQLLDWRNKPRHFNVGTKC